MQNNYTPSKKILEKYADVLVNYALNSGDGVKKGEVVRIVAEESARPLYFELQKAVLKAGGHVIGTYIPDDKPDMNFSKMAYDTMSDEQIRFLPKRYQKALVDDVDHTIHIISNAMISPLKGVDPKKMMQRGEVFKPFSDMRVKKENEGKYTWTIALYGTDVMAKEARLTPKQYWDQIIKACYLNEAHPVTVWRKAQKDLKKYEDKLNALPIDRMHLEGKDVDLWIKLTPKSKWIGGTGRNIPSFEIFTSPDWRGTEGWIRFNQPLYQYGNLITGIELWFEKGVVVKSKATKNHNVLKQMIATKNADKVGEFSMTDGRFSRITKFMGETLYDENMGGKYGNTHIALGKAYKDCYTGDPSNVPEKEWQRLGYNDSSVHTDIISTTDRTITAYMTDGTKKVIYKDGQYQF